MVATAANELASLPQLDSIEGKASLAIAQSDDSDMVCRATRKGEPFDLGDAFITCALEDPGLLTALLYSSHILIQNGGVEVLDIILAQAKNYLQDLEAQSKTEESQL